jgi:cobalt-zinc-cadmium resistance protein CzcA
MGAEFTPQLDEGDFALHAILKPGTALSDVSNITSKIEKIILENFPNEVESVQSRIGVANLPTDPMPMDIGDIFVILKPKQQWKKIKTKQELIDSVKIKLNCLPGVNYEFSQPIEMRFNELLTGIREDIAIKLFGDNPETLNQKANEIVKLISGINGIESIKAEATKGLPQITIKYNRTSMAQFGLNINDVNTIIQTAISGKNAGYIFENEKIFELIVRLNEKSRKNIEDIENIYIPTKNGNQIPIKLIADINYKPGPMQISRENTHRRTYVGINVKNRDIKTLVSEIQQTLNKKLKLPPGYYIQYGGAFENLEKAVKRLNYVVPAALLLIFILVYFAIKSLKQTLIIYIAIPFAAIGGIFSLYFRNMPFSISAGIGFIVLFGVAVLNGLVLISAFNDLLSQKKFSITQIIKKGTTRRLRPILLTASTDILGFLPMAISSSAGAEIQQPLATVVIGGMISATLLTLIILPILYSFTTNTNQNI